MSEERKALHTIRVDLSQLEGEKEAARVEQRLAEAARRAGEDRGYDLDVEGVGVKRVQTWVIYSQPVLKEFQALGGES